MISESYYFIFKSNEIKSKGFYKIVFVIKFSGRSVIRNIYIGPKLINKLKDIDVLATSIRRCNQIGESCGITTCCGGTVCSKGKCVKNYSIPYPPKPASSCIVKTGCINNISGDLYAVSCKNGKPIYQKCRVGDSCASSGETANCIYNPDFNTGQCSYTCTTALECGDGDGKPVKGFCPYDTPTCCRYSGVTPEPTIDPTPECEYDCISAAKCTLYGGDNLGTLGCTGNKVCCKDL
ncbi:hypothetical protein HYV31_01875 [candidate division WWE3 bacterium]|nr:hypothetical protein [candidate division WWE3 bacterium]